MTLLGRVAVILKGFKDEHVGPSSTAIPRLKMIFFSCYTKFMLGEGLLGPSRTL